MYLQRLVKTLLWGFLLLVSSAYAQNPPPIGPVVISEIFLNSSEQDDGHQWVELFNRTNIPVNLRNYSLGNAGHAGTGLNYTQSLVQLSGVVPPFGFFVVGGPISNPKNGTPTYNQPVNFEPDFVHNTHSADGVGLYSMRAEDVLSNSIPVDVIIYGNFLNNNRLIDNRGKPGVIDIRQVGPDSSIERTSFETNIWRVQPSPNPGSIIDTKPPTSVNLNCDQNLNDIILTWRPSEDPKPGSGLSGYRILRDNEVVAIVSPTALSYTDQIQESTQDILFEYQIQPYDSAGNIQILGGKRKCLYDGIVQITMSAEPEFTPGTSNAVSWSGSPKIEVYSLFAAEACDAANSIEIRVTERLFTVPDLKNGTGYCFWVSALDRKQRRVVSDTVSSIQDARSPNITRFEIRGTKQVNGIAWVLERRIALDLKASDLLPGRIRALQLFENDRQILDREISSNEVDFTLAHTLISNPCAKIELTARVIDAAGNERVQVLEINLDDAPPAPIGLANCRQLTARNGVLLDWGPSFEPTGCSGLSGYIIRRDGDEIVRLASTASTFEDLFPAERASGRITYQIQPYDSLGRLQNDGGFTHCDYVGASTIQIRGMTAYTPGLSNEVCWSKTGTLSSVNVFVAKNCQAESISSVSFANPGLGEICHVFEELQDGQAYCYWVNGIDQQERIVSSDTVFSIQDNSSPIIENITIPSAEFLNGRSWIYSRNIQLTFVAQDARPGVIKKYEIFENGHSTAAIKLVQPAAQISKTLSLALRTPALAESQEFKLSVLVYDGAGNPSDTENLLLQLQQNQPKLFAFPNPFNPLKEQTTIRLVDVNESEVKIYDFFGNLVRTLDQKANKHDFLWDGRNGLGNLVSNGGYICVAAKTKMRFKIAVVKQTADKD